MSNGAWELALDKVEALEKEIEELKEKAGLKNAIVFETFRGLTNYHVGLLKQHEPSCFNGIVRVTKTRVRVEQISEPLEVYTERLQKLWEDGDNYHHYTPIEKEAARLGVKLEGPFGLKRKGSKK